MSRPTAVIGSTGKTGRRIIPRLLDAGVEVRPLGRSTEPAFDWDQPDGWAAALAGVGRLYVAFVPDLAGPGAERSIARLLEVASAVGIERIVLLSGRGEAGAERCEQLVLGSGIPAVIVRASWFAQNFTEGMLSRSTV